VAELTAAALPPGDSRGFPAQQRLLMLAQASEAGGGASEAPPLDVSPGGGDELAAGLEVSVSSPAELRLEALGPAPLRTMRGAQDAAAPACASGDAPRPAPGLGRAR
jgi:hypothetical protein